MTFAGRIWDPLNSKDWDRTVCWSPAPLNRINSDINEFGECPGIYIERDEENVAIVHAIIIGPEDTPYDGGFFYFIIRFPPTYPKDPPRVKFLTTDGGTVRFNPTLYADGMVCLSNINNFFLGGPIGWGPSTWTAAQRLRNILEDRRTVLSEEPYYLEPPRNFLRGMFQLQSMLCNQFLIHETLRVAVCQMVENPPESLPENLRTKIEEIFLENYAKYTDRVAVRLRNEHQGKKMVVLKDDLVDTGKTFDYKSIQKKLQEIHKKLSNRNSTSVVEDEGTPIN